MDYGTLLEIVKCGVCKDRMKQPKTLPCNHSFCMDCIDETHRCRPYTTNDAKCPVCRRRFVLTYGGAAELPDNFHLNELLEKLEKARNDGTDNKTPIPCQKCPEKSATSTCVECYLNLCDKCVETHSAIPDATNHNVFNLSDLDQFQRESLVRMTMVTAKCMKHNLLPSRYCLDKLCMKLVCPECCLDDHKTHDLLNLNESASLSKEKLKNISEKAQLMEVKTRIEIDRFDQIIADKSAAKDSFKVQVSMLFAEFREKLSKFEEQLLDKGCKKYDEAISKVEKHKRESESMMANIAEIVQNAKATQKVGTNAFLVSEQHHLKGWLEEVENERAEMNDSDNNVNIEIVKEKDSVKISEGQIYRIQETAASQGREGFVSSEYEKAMNVVRITEHPDEDLREDRMYENTHQIDSRRPERTRSVLSLPLPSPPSHSYSRHLSYPSLNVEDRDRYCNFPDSRQEFPTRLSFERKMHIDVSSMISGLTVTRNNEIIAAFGNEKKVLIMKYDERTRKTTVCYDVKRNWIQPWDAAASYDEKRKRTTVYVTDSDKCTRLWKTKCKPSLEDQINIYDVKKFESVNESEEDVTSQLIDIIDEHQIISNHEIVNDAKHEFHNTYDMSLTDGQIQEEESSLDSLNQWIDKSTVVLRDPYCRERWTDEHQIVLHHEITNDAKQKGPDVDFQLHITHDMSLTEGQITEEEVILDSLKQGIDINIQEKQKEMLSRICGRNIKFRAIRLITVGAKKTGKTALCKLLFKDNPHNVMVGRRDLRTLNEKTRDLVEQFIQRSAPDRGDAVSLRFFCHDLEGGMQNLQLHTSLHVSEATYLVHYRIDEYKEKRKAVAQQIYDYLKMIQKEHVNVEGNDSAESRMPTFSPTFLLIGTDGKEQDLEVESFTSNLHQDIFSCGDKSFNLKHIILTDILHKTTIHNDVEDIIYTILNQAYRHKDNVVSIPGSWLLIENEIFKWKSPGKVIQMEDIRRCMEGISLDLSTNEFEDFMTYFSRTYHIAVVNKDMIPKGSLSLIYPSLIVDAFELKTSSVCFYCKQNLNATTDSFILRALDHLQLVDFGISEFSNIIGKHAIFKLNDDAFFLLCCTDSLLKMTLLTGNGCSTEERIELVTEALKGYHCFDCLDETIELFISNCPFIHSDDPHLITDDRLQYSCCSYFDESSSVVPWLKQTLTSRESSQEGSSVLVVPIFKRKIEFKPDCEIEDESMPTKEKIEYLTTNEKTFDLLDRMENSSADMLFVYYCVEGIFEGYDIEGIALAVVGSRFPLATTAHCLDFYSYLLRNCNESTDSTKDSITNLEDAILHGDLTLQKENLQDLDTSLYQEQGWSSLHLASYIGDVKGCTILLESGHLSNRAMATQPEGQFDKGIAYRYALSNFRFTPTYPLLLAVFFRHIEVIYLLLEKTDDHDTLQYCLRLTEGLHLEKTVAARIYKKVCSVYSEGNLRRELFRNVTRHNEPLIGFIKVYDSNDPKKSVQFVGYCKDLMFTKHFRCCGIDIHIQNPWQFSEQLSSKRKYTKRCLTEIENANFDLCLKENSENLWTKHSNLNVITAAVTEDDQLTVLLLCSSKGFIPEKEDPFPKFLAYGIGKKLPVKVNEGHFKFDMRDYDFTDVRQENLCMGADIAVENENYAGSLGLFVELGQKKGFVTCCHVLFHDSIKTSGFEFDIASCGTKNVIQPSSGERFLSNLPLVCGKVLKAIFKADSSGKTDDDTCIDAALVEITDLTRIPSTGCFTVKKCHQFKKEGFDEVPTFSSGRSERNITRALRDKRLVKSGNTTGFTGGRFILYGSQIRYPCSAHLIAEGAVGNKQIFHGQYEVSGRTSEPFTLEGDSGAAVFLVEDDDSLHCIGIVIGHHHTDGGLLRTVVTPIEPVLKSLGLETYLSVCRTNAYNLDVFLHIGLPINSAVPSYDYGS